MIVHVKDPIVTAEFRDGRDDVVCVVEDMPTAAVLTVNPNLGSIDVPFACGATIMERDCDHVRFEGVLHSVNGSPCGTVSVSVDAPLVGVVLTRCGIGS